MAAASIARARRPASAAKARFSRAMPRAAPAQPLRHGLRRRDSGAPERVMDEPFDAVPGDDLQEMIPVDAAGGEPHRIVAPRRGGPAATCDGELEFRGEAHGEGSSSEEQAYPKRLAMNNGLPPQDGSMYHRPDESGDPSKAYDVRFLA